MDRSLIDDSKRRGLFSTMVGKIADLEDFRRKHLAQNHALGDVRNFLINGGFDFAERQDDATAFTTIASQDYGPDRWWSDRANANIQYQRVDATGESGLHCRFYGSYKKVTNAGKIFITQVVEGVNSVPMRGRHVTFSICMKASAAYTIRMAILQLATAGTIDAPPATLVTAFGAAGTDPTLGANIAVIGTTESKSVTTNWQQFSVNVTVPSDAKNILVALWSNGNIAAGDTVSLAQAGLYITPTPPAWMPVPIADELEKCHRYGFRYDEAIDTHGMRRGTQALEVPFTFPVKMRIVPTGTSTITGWTNAAPGTTTVGFFNAVTNAYTIITGALTVNLAFNVGQRGGIMLFSAATSFDGTRGDGGRFECGPNVVIFFDAELL